MDFVRRPAKIHKKVKLGNWYKKLKKRAKLLWLRPLIPLFTNLFTAQAPQPWREESLSFMTCIIKVDASKPGWQKAVLALLRNCKDARFKMDQNGVVEVSGIADPNQLLKKIGKASRLELHWFQFGQCSSNLFMPETNKDPAQQKRNPHNSFPPYAQYGYSYQPPQMFNPYTPF
ncbi:hypothetical protein Sango_0268700 [Sesamum angolense]|uniref:HMA domain-containing protein n=1 Tax=Sesamum angolense TaxID=2727404 RepID=A0AAE2C2P7_9LAMI|nr:hypothetical protein Sango_0268700 [Sesamum angolense]